MMPSFWTCWIYVIARWWVGVWGILVVCYMMGCHFVVFVLFGDERTYRYQPVTRVYRIRYRIGTHLPRPACMSVSRSPSNAPAMVHVFAVSLSLSFTRPPLAFDKTQQFRCLPVIYRSTHRSNSSAPPTILLEQTTTTTTITTLR